MISEKKFIEQYKNFWKEIFPGLNNYLRKINRRKIKDSVIEEDGEIKSLQETNDLIGFANDIAFHFFEEEVNGKKSIFSKSEILVVYRNFKELHKYKHFQNSDLDDKLILKEHQVIEQIKAQLSSRYSLKSPIVHPQLHGCGFQNEVRGDIFYNDTLVEVKARIKTNENSKSAGFRSDDIIQLFIYGALYFSEHREEQNKSRYGELKHFELFNPRMGCCWKENIDVVAENISGGSATDVFDEVIRFISYTNTSL